MSGEYRQPISHQSEIRIEFSHYEILLNLLIDLLDMRKERTFSDEEDPHRRLQLVQPLLLLESFL